MSASHIPNLNTLRRGAGRGRFRTRGGAAAASGGSNASDAGPGSKDTVVQGTDQDASVSRLSAVNLGYLEDRYAQALASPGMETRRMPIINRGTYIRTTAIDHLVTDFLSSSTAPKQIISLGAGSDTRVFRLLSQTPRPTNLIYHELDFATNTASKIKLIRASPLLQRVLGSDVTISPTGDALHSPNYHLHPVDLRTLSQQQPPPPPPPQTTSTPTPTPTPGIDTTLPTLLISECCLIYLTPHEASAVVRYFSETLFPTSVPLGLIIYEPIRPDDAFGRTMVANLATRGIQLQTLQQYATLEAQRGRLRAHGFGDGQAAADVDFIWERWVAAREKDRVAAVEMLDEMEEWRLLARHYCVVWGWRDTLGLRVFDAWRAVEGQDV
ncbi:leucine carboxyl methyltransferase [Aspergillus ellipticus CBS 707.79]|uniref:Leucine carboxyl methyltransferase 1 n=1 Tax=Aspergillus ellipticus CBS 707.79 TaxID=1448320 RepID=A0A319CWW2_9EURO|nr:leucine carboxyl methyltransferase [Aspergillus ellipticus CBS 707.79]